VLYLLARAGQWAVLADPSRRVDGMEHVVDVLNQCVLWSLPFVAVVLIAVTVPEFRAIRRGASQTP
jgi:hypothetical protein